MQNLIIFDLKGDPPVSTDRDAPCSGPIPGQLMHTPAWRSLHPTDIRRNDQHGHNFTYSIHQIRPKAPVIVILKETPEPSMSHTADMHITIVRQYRTVVKRFDNLAFQTESLYVSWQTHYWALKN
jgi:hypothetical protein